MGAENSQIKTGIEEAPHTTEEVAETQQKELNAQDKDKDNKGKYPC